MIRDEFIVRVKGNKYSVLTDYVLTGDREEPIEVVRVEPALIMPGNGLDDTVMLDEVSTDLIWERVHNEIKEYHEL